MRVRSAVAVLMVAALFSGMVSQPATGQDRPTPGSSPQAEQRKDSAKKNKNKKAGVALLLTGIGLVAGGGYLATTYKFESSGSLMNCPPPRSSCFPGAAGWPFCQQTYCYSDYKQKDNPGHLYGGIGLIGAGAVALIAGIRRLL